MTSRCSCNACLREITAGGSQLVWSADFLGQLFEGSYHLFALADKIEEIKTVCWYCDRKATMNMRLADGKPVFEGAQIHIGGNESYLPVCRKCYSMQKNNQTQPH